MAEKVVWAGATWYELQRRDELGGWVCLEKGIASADLIRRGQQVQSLNPRRQYRVVEVAPDG